MAKQPFRIFRDSSCDDSTLEELKREHQATLGVATPPPSRIERAAAFAMRHRLVLFVVALTLLTVLYPLSRSAKKDQSLQSLFGKQSPYLVAYDSVVRDFGGDSTCLLAYHDEKLFTPDGFSRMTALREKLAQIPGILKATCLADVPVPGEISGATVGATYFQTADQAGLKQRLLDCPLYRDILIAGDGLTTGIVLQVDRAAMASGDFSNTLTEVRKLADQLEPRGEVVGSPALLTDVFDYLEWDARLLTVVATIAMMGVILILFRNARWMILPFAIVQSAIIVTQSLVALGDVQLSIVGSMTASLITVIGIGTSIHIAVRYGEELQSGADRVQALQQTFARLMPAIFWTCTTTAIGFAALLVSPVPPVKSYAFVMTTASMVVGIAAFALIPGGILLGRFASKPQPAPGEDKLVGALKSLGDWTTKNSVLTGVGIVFVLATAVYGCRWLRVETDFTANFRENSRILEGYRFVENNLGGAGIIEVAFDAPGGLSPSSLDQLRRLETRLRDVPGITKVIGLADLLDFTGTSQKSSAGAGWGAWLNPISPQLLLDGKLAMLKLAQPELYHELYNADAGRLRMVVRVREKQDVAEKQRLLLTIRSITEEEMKGPAAVTGLYVLVTYLIDNIVGDQVTSFAISALGIFVCMTIAFRSLTYGLIAFVPNIIPIVAVIGLMGWLGWPINLATAMISSISMGLVVDFSIHYLSRFRFELGTGANFEEALARTQQTTGKAMVFSNLALMLGFSVLAFSNFVPTAQFGALVTVAILSGLAGNLLVVPVLLRLLVAPKLAANQRLASHDSAANAA